MKLGMFTSGYQYYPLEAAFQDAKRIGYDYIELWGGRPHAFPPDLKRGGIEQVKKLIEVYEMPVHVYTPEHNAYPYNYMIGDSSQRKEAVDYLYRSCGKYHKPQTNPGATGRNAEGTGRICTTDPGTGFAGDTDSF